MIIKIIRKIVKPNIYFKINDIKLIPQKIFPMKKSNLLVTLIICSHKLWKFDIITYDLNFKLF